MNDFSTPAMDNGASDKPVITRNTMRNIRQIVTAISCFALLLPISSSAQRRDEAPWYDVEMIIFTHNSAGAGSTEQWSDEPGNPDFEGAFRFSIAEENTRRGSPATAAETPIVSDEIGLPTALYTLLPESEWRLTSELSRLKRSRGKLMPLIHTAWRQQMRSRDETVPLHLTSNDQIASETPILEGVIQVSVQRYLHLNFDLTHREARDISNTVDAGSFALQSMYRDYRITNHRKMRSGELHFIDHPKVGMLILVSKFKVPEVETLAPEPVVETPIEAAKPAPDATTAVETPQVPE
ncbi:MAG: CsiV family protein [Candidatus Sedimenticola sp. (ex Thyasira tokunagai)]